MSQPNQNSLPENDRAQANPPMHWHKLLVRGMLWLPALAAVLQAVWVFAGNIYYAPQVRDQLYAGIPGLRIADFALGACLILAADLLFAARKQLKNNRWRGAVLLQCGCALLALAQLVHALARYFIAGLSPLNLPMLAQLLGYGALLLVNRSYYRKRRSLFQ